MVWYGVRTRIWVGEAVASSIRALVSAQVLVRSNLLGTSPLAAVVDEVVGGERQPRAEVLHEATEAVAEQLEHKHHGNDVTNTSYMCAISCRHRIVPLHSDACTGLRDSRSDASPPSMSRSRIRLTAAKGSTYVAQVVVRARPEAEFHLFVRVGDVPGHGNHDLRVIDALLAENTARDCDGQRERFVEVSLKNMCGITLHKLFEPVPDIRTLNHSNKP